jgi:hypothetical protein
MKTATKYLVVVLSIYSYSAMAQITISQSQYPDSVGYNTMYLQSGGLDVNLGTTGGPQRWDFSQVQDGAFEMQYSDVSPNESPFGTTHNWGSNRFASVAQNGILFGGSILDVGNTWSYFRYGTNSYEIIGVFVPGDTLYLPRPDQADSIISTCRLAVFPQTYNQSWTDSLKTTIVLNDTVVLGSPKHRRLRVMVRTQNTIDAYGTLVYPGDSVQALRQVTVASGAIAYDIQAIGSIYLTLATIPIPGYPNTTVSYIAQNIGTLVSATSDSGITTPTFTTTMNLRQSARHYNPSAVRQPTVHFALPQSPEINVSPNPFNPATRLTFTSPVGGRANLVLYNVLGRQVAVLYSGTMSSGTSYQTQWGGSYPAGSYFARLTVNGITTTTRLERLP